MNHKKVFIYRGLHSKKLYELLKENWESNNFILLLPLQIKDFSFLHILKAISTEMHFVGEWTHELKIRAYEAELKEQVIKPAEQTILSQAALGIFTSGTSTGKPKLVFYSKQNILSSLESIRKLFDLERIKTIFVYPQPTHCFGLILGYMQSVIYQHKIYFHEGPYSKKAHEHWVQSVNENTLTLGAPVHFFDLLQYVKENKNRIKSSYSAIIGGAHVSQNLWTQIQENLKIQNPSVGYGTTEASPGITHLPPGMKPEQDGDIGFLLDQVHLECEKNQICFSGPNMCLATYDNFLIKTESKIILNDVLGLIEIPGTQKRFHFLGRSDLLINRGAQKISLELLEGIVASHFNCKCVAVAFYDQRLDQDIALLIEPKGNEKDIDVEMIQKKVENDCAFRMPLQNIIFSKIPLNANNKYDRKEALKNILKRKKLTFPVPIEYLKNFLPHSGSAIWIDQLLETKKNFGRTETKLKSDANYLQNKKLIESSLIEFVAQSFGYMLALNDILDVQKVKPVTTALIAEVKDAQFYFSSFDRTPEAEDIIQVTTLGTQDFGALKVVQGQIFFQNRILANLNVKLYCN